MCKDAPLSPALTYHDLRERHRAGARLQVENWRAAGGFLYLRITGEGEEPIVRIAAGERAIESTREGPRPLPFSHLVLWRREVRMVPANFEAHAAEMGVVESTEGGITRLESRAEKLVLERDARSGVPLRMIDLRSNETRIFEQALFSKGRLVPRVEVHTRGGKEAWRDRIVLVEFDVPVPAEVRHLWDTLATS